MRKEIRKLIAIWLFDLTMWVLPSGNFKDRFIFFISNNLDSL